MITTERQHTERSSQLPIEDVFTCHDINPNLAYDKFTGSNFDFPQKWAMTDSSNKVIGLRKLDMIPSSHTFSLAIRVYDEPPRIPDKLEDWDDYDIVGTKTYDTKPLFFSEGKYSFPLQYLKDNVEDKTPGMQHIAITGHNLYNIGHSTTVTNNKLTEILQEHDITEDGKYEIRTYKLQTIANVNAKWKQTIFKSFSVLEDNSLIEIIHLIVNEFSEFMSKHSYTFSYSYNREYGSIHFSVVNNELVRLPFEFKFVTNRDAAEFLKFLNQKIHYNYLYILTDHLSSHIFPQDVWDRKHVYFHSTFSDTKRGYLGKNKDDLSQVNKLFKYSHGNTSFNIRFTTDGLNNFLPKFCNFVIEFVFILNYRNNFITYLEI